MSNSDTQTLDVTGEETRLAPEKKRGERPKKYWAADRSGNLHWADTQAKAISLACEANKDIDF